MNFRPKAILFDVDGTLIRSQGAGRRALISAAASTFKLDSMLVQKELEQIDFRGNTDTLIFEELFTRLQIPQTTPKAPLTAAYLEALDVAVNGAEVKLLPGVKGLLDIFLNRPSTHVGLLTGNIRAGARRKLAAVGLDHLTEGPGGFGDEGRRRDEIAAVALERLAALGVPAWSVLIVGDTEHDVFAAHRVGSPAAAIATGWTEYDVLEKCGAQVLLRDLSDPGLLVTFFERM
ncbi:MAG: HAD hydrolase-like protein [Myxococcota bacterium]